MGIARRGKKGLFQHFRRVPKRYRLVENRSIIRTALKTENETLARSKAAQIELAQDAAWEAVLAGNSGAASAQFDALQQVADARGVLYLPAKQVAQLPLHDLLKRVELVSDEPRYADAVLGAAKPPKLRLSELFDVYEEMVKDRQVTKSEDQLRRWRAPRQKAITSLIAQIGDGVVSEISRDQALQFRRWWWKRIEAQEVLANSANKDMTYLSAMLEAVAKFKGYDFTNPFKGLRFAEQEQHRATMTADWIADKILAKGALDGLNEQARAILLVMVNTGARPSEIIGLKPEHIHLSAAVPCIEIRAEGRSLKTKHSARDLPLVGISLEAIKSFPTGFPRYRDKTTNWSNLVSKYLRNNGLFESQEQSAYSLRHALSDRLQNAGCEDRTRKEIMGHRPEKIIYGQGASLELKHDWLLKVSL